MDERRKLPQAETYKDWNGHMWYSPEYMQEMMQREYDRGVKDGRGEPVVHICEIVEKYPSELKQ
jgi:hypothetical protein